jgi:predicted nucleotidyltransferase
MKALNFYNENLPIGEIDLILDFPVRFEELKKRSVKIELGEDRVPVVSIRDLIELELKAGRKQDLADVEHLRAILER